MAVTVERAPELCRFCSARLFALSPFTATETNALTAVRQMVSPYIPGRADTRVLIRGATGDELLTFRVPRGCC
jgi:hypothetical protein